MSERERERERKREREREREGGERERGLSETGSKWDEGTMGFNSNQIPQKTFHITALCPHDALHFNSKVSLA